MKEPVYFLKLELERFRFFGENATLDLSDGNGNWKRWNIILGDNGTGKTTLLQLLSAYEIVQEQNTQQHASGNSGYYYVPIGFRRYGFNLIQGKENSVKAYLSLNPSLKDKHRSY